ncbi:RNA methyltransferase, TrmH family [Aspergillus sclerotioniger CBS 115572]|uniref:rRNA methyltransferase 1, mitochondrial n=1 Tax=Aspergillus sclerotioniger CBS 115572 TaxID=1450535 RepID=A0A317WYU8_9EURO|nr:RNA methyltransferase, TrmH family [Aspergillus sclerotioniger CBS 115572]PWY91566.1 RNA methyltransferase, TrmH family [Aspergillus sclerotioniger CBS 115572]
MSLHSSLVPLRLYLRSSVAPAARLHSIRHASLNSAIGRGIRRSHPVDGPRKDRRDRNMDRDGDSRPPRSGYKDTREPRRAEVEFDEDEFIRTGNFRALPRVHQRFENTRSSSRMNDMSRTRDTRDMPRTKDNGHPKDRTAYHRTTEKVPVRVKENVLVPDSIPYTTPASEFIYGGAAVEAALRCSRRKLYKLYLYQAAGEELSSSKIALRKLALSKNVAIKMAFAGWDRLLDKMSAGRPHNGCVLEVSPLPQLPVKSFKTVSSAEENHFSLELGVQSREEAQVNGTNDRIKINHSLRNRYPVVLLLDGIIDPGNLGAIIRSAYYLGVEAIVFAGRNSAPLSPVTIKSSAGAAENMTLLHVRNEVEFIQRSKTNGWRFYAADAPGPGSTLIDPSSLWQTSSTGDGSSASEGPLAQSPSVIMMGSEGTGLSSHIRSQADAIVSIPGARISTELGVESDPARVDSLNVSVAAALLMDMFLRMPFAMADMPKKGKLW